MSKLKNFAKRFFHRTKKILNSKLTVAAVVLAIIGVGVSPAISKTFADDGPDTSTSTYYNFGTVYQQYMLANGNKLKDQSKSGGFGMMGSGGVSGTFSYTAIRAQGSDLGHPVVANAFGNMMGTYSFYNYFSYSPHGFDSILSFLLRLFFGIILSVGGMMLDIVDMMMNLVTSLLLRLNIIPLLSSAFTSTDLGDKMLANLNITKSVFETVMNYSMLSLIAVLLILIFMVLRKGSRNIDRGRYTDLKNRIITLIFLPLTMVAAAYLFQDISQLTNDSNKGGQSEFARYLVDVQSWAYNYNLAPGGNNRDDMGGFGEDESPQNQDGYVNMTFNPYQEGAGSGASRIAAINAGSQLTKSNQMFANSSLALNYLSGVTFSARDYLDYEATQRGGSVSSNSSYGGYYEYSHGGWKGGSTASGQSAATSDVRYILTDVHSHGYQPDKSADMDGDLTAIEKGKDGGATGYSKAISDYVAQGDEDHPYGQSRSFLASGVTMWQDRFVYGAKKTGAAMDKYYGEEPSNEQVANTVGMGGSGNSLSTESTFLALNTTFNQSGGYYYLDAPARGVMKAAAVFDSSKSDYYRVSMLGLAGFTVPAMLTKVILRLVVFITVMLVVLSVGVIEMNLKPFKAWFKALFTGKIQYLQAFAIYTAGVVGTYMFLFMMPDIMIALFDTVIEFVTEIFGKAVGNGGNASVDLTQAGMGKLAGFGVSLGIAHSILKFPKISMAFMALMSYPWDWASSAGEKLEMDADSRAGHALKGKAKNRLNKFDQFAASAASTALKGSKGLATSYSGMRDRFNSGGDNFKDRLGSVMNGDTKLRDPKKATMVDRLKNGMTPKNLLRGLNPAGMSETAKVLGVGGAATATGAAAGYGARTAKDLVDSPELSGAEDTLRDLENTENLHDRTKDSVQEARMAKDEFDNNPTPESKERLQKALAQLNEDVQDDPNADTNYRHQDLLSQASEALENYKPQADIPMTRDGQVDKDSPEAQKMLQDAVRDAEIARVLGNNMGENPLDPKAKQRLRAARQRLNNAKGQFAVEPSRENYEKMQEAQDNLQTEMGSTDTLSQEDKDRIIRQYGAGDSRFLNRQLNKADSQAVPQTVDDLSDMAEKIEQKRNLPQDQRDKMEDLQAAIQNYKQEGSTASKAALVDAIAKANPVLDKQGNGPVDASQLYTAPKKISSIEDVTNALAKTAEKPDLSVRDRTLVQTAQDAIDTYNFDQTESSKRAMLEAVKNARPVLDQASMQPLNLTKPTPTVVGTAGLEQALIQARASRQATPEDQTRLAEAAQALDAYKADSSEANKLALAKAVGNAQSAAEKTTGKSLDFTGLTTSAAGMALDGAAIAASLANAKSKAATPAATTALNGVQNALNKYQADNSIANEVALKQAIDKANPAIEQTTGQPLDFSQLTTPKATLNTDAIEASLQTAQAQATSPAETLDLNAVQTALNNYQNDSSNANEAVLKRAVSKANPTITKTTGQPLDLAKLTTTKADFNTATITTALAMAIPKVTGAQGKQELANVQTALDKYQKDSSAANQAALTQAVNKANPVMQQAGQAPIDVSKLTIPTGNNGVNTAAITAALSNATSKVTDTQDKQVLANVQTALADYQKNASTANQNALTQAIASANPVVQKSGSAPIDLSKVMPKPAVSADQTAITNALAGAMASAKVTSSDDKAVLNQVEKAMQKYQKEETSANKLALAHAISKANPVVKKSGNKPIDLSKINLGKPVANQNSFDGLTNQMVKVMGNTQNLQSNEKAMLNQVNRAMNAYQKQSNAQTKQALTQAIQHANPVIKKSGGVPIDLSKMSFATDKSKNLINSGLGNIKNETLQKAVQNLQSSNSGNYKENQAQFERALKNLTREERGQIRRADLKDGIAGLQRELGDIANPDKKK